MGQEHDRALAAVAARQHGVVSLDQAVAAGVPPQMIRRQVRGGRWRRLHRGVYAVAGAPASPRQPVVAACLAAGEGAVASHATAAQVWELLVPAGDAVDVLTHPGRRVRLAGVRHHRSAHLPVDDLGWRRDVPVTSVARTLVDCAPQLPGPRLGAAVDDALRRDVLRFDRLVACVERLEPSRGRLLQPLRDVIAHRRGRGPGGSAGEAWVLDTIVGAGLPEPVQQHPIVVGGRRRFVDLAYPERRIAIEFDGFDVHQRMRSRFVDDRVRQNDLVLAQWTVLRFTGASTRAEVVTTTAAALAAAGAA
jgi:hypothetical protein